MNAIEQDETAIKLQEQIVEIARERAEQALIEKRRFISIAAEFEKASIAADAFLINEKLKLREMQMGSKVGRWS